MSHYRLPTTKSRGHMTKLQVSSGAEAVQLWKDGEHTKVKGVLRGRRAANEHPQRRRYPRRRHPRVAGMLRMWGQVMLAAVATTAPTAPPVTMATTVGLEADRSDDRCTEYVALGFCTVGPCDVLLAKPCQWSPTGTHCQGYCPALTVGTDEDDADDADTGLGDVTVSSTTTSRRFSYVGWGRCMGERNTTLQAYVNTVPIPVSISPEIDLFQAKMCAAKCLLLSPCIGFSMGLNRGEGECHLYGNGLPLTAAGNELDNGRMLTAWRREQPGAPSWGQTGIPTVDAIRGSGMVGIAGLPPLSFK